MATTYTLTKKATVQDRKKGYAYTKGKTLSAAEYKKLAPRHASFFTATEVEEKEEVEETKKPPSA